MLRFAATPLLVALALAAASGRAEARPAGGSVVGGGEVMTNEKVIALFEAGLSEELIIRKVEGAGRTQFDTGTDGLIKLKAAGIPDTIVKSMMDIYEKETNRLDREVRILIQVLLTDDPDEYDRALRGLVRVGAYAVPLLEAGLTNEDERIRAGCAEVLGQIADPPSLEALFLVLADRHKAVRARAAKAVSMFDRTKVVPRLVELLGRRGQPRDGVALALGHIGDASYAPALLGLAAAPGDEDDKAAAAYSLGLLGDPRPEVVGVLIEGAMDDVHRRLREASARALALLAPAMKAGQRYEAAQALVKSLRRYPAGRDVLALQLRYFPGRTGVEALLEFLGSREQDVQTACHEALKVMTGETYPLDPGRWHSWWEIAKAQPLWREEEYAPPAGGAPPETPPAESSSGAAAGAMAPPVVMPAPGARFVPEPDRP